MNIQWKTWIVVSQAARQGLAVLMASASLVLKHETSTLRQSHNFISIDLKFGVSDNVRKVNSPTKFGSDPISSRDATWGQHIRVLWLFFIIFIIFFFCFLFFYSLTELQPIPVIQFSRTMAQKTQFVVRKTLLGWEMCNSENMGVFEPKNTHKTGCKGKLPAKIKCQITPKWYEIRDMCQWTMIMKLGSYFQIPSTKLV